MMKNMRSLSLLALLIVAPSAFAGNAAMTLCKLVTGTAIGATTAVTTGVGASVIHAVTSESNAFVKYVAAAALHAGNIAANQALRDHLASALDKDAASADQKENPSVITKTSEVVSAVATVPALALAYYGDNVPKRAFAAFGQWLDEKLDLAA